MVPEGLVGIAGLFDDVLVALVFFLHITTVYRTILISLDRARVARATAPARAVGVGAAGAPTPTATATPHGSDGRGLGGVAFGAGTAAVFGIVVGAMTSLVGAGSGAAAFAAVAIGFATAAAGSSLNVRAMPPLARSL